VRLINVALARIFAVNFVNANEPYAKITFFHDTLGFSLEEHALKNVNNYLNTNIYSYLETSGGQSYNIYSNVVHFFNTSVN
jgi:hypothetical protein